MTTRPCSPLREPRDEGLEKGAAGYQKPGKLGLPSPGFIQSKAGHRTFCIF